MKKILLSLFIITCVFILGASNANATLITYTDRTSFETAAGTTTVEDFQSFVVDTPFHTTPVDVGDFTLSMIGSPNTSYNYIDIGPPASAETNVNGTTNMRVFTDNSPSFDLIFTFDTAITAFGADFANINDDILRTRLLVGSEIATPPINPYPFVSFYGFTSDVAFTSITFEGLENDVYGIDNVTYSPIPEPTTMLLLGTGLIGLAGFRRKFRKK